MAVDAQRVIRDAFLNKAATSGAAEESRAKASRTLKSTDGKAVVNHQLPGSKS